jgi:hypothetical protein
MEFLGEPRLSGVVDGLIARPPACPNHATAFNRFWPSLSGSLNGCFPNFVRKDERVVAGFSGDLLSSIDGILTAVTLEDFVQHVWSDGPCD